MKHIEIESIEHAGVVITYKIDYDKEKISLVERNGPLSGNGEWAPKQWVFTNRGLEYMQGWINILEAIENAITIAKVRLADHIEKKAKEKEDLIIKAALDSAKG